VPAQFPKVSVLAIISFRLAAALCGLLVRKKLLSKDEARELCLGASANLEPVHDPDIVRARELLNELADSIQ
jgi:hypothetical protein